MFVTVAVARTAAEEERIERRLREAGIDFDVTFDAVPDAADGAACLLAHIYKVEAALAERAKACIISSE